MPAATSPVVKSVRSTGYGARPVVNVSSAFDPFRRPFATGFETRLLHPYTVRNWLSVSADDTERSGDDASTRGGTFFACPYGSFSEASFASQVA